MSLAQEQSLFVSLKSSIVLFLAFSGICFGQSTWEWRNPIPQGAVPYFTTFGNGRYVAVGQEGKIWTSSDGITWEIRSSGTSKMLMSVRYCNDQFLAVGIGGTILTSPDGVTWGQMNSGTLNPLNSVTYGNGLFVIVGQGISLTSSDGCNWTVKSFVTILNSVTYSNKLFVAVGETNTILTSPDGATWTKRYSGEQGYSLCSVTFGNGRFVAMGDLNTILTSTDGTTWTTINSDAAVGFDEVIYCDSQFVAVSLAGQGQLLTSPDGTTWTTKNSVSRFYSIAYGNSKFVAVGYANTIWTSLDAKTWTLSNSVITNSLSSVTYGTSPSGDKAGQFVAISDDGSILASPNGATWYIRNSDTTCILSSVAYGKGTFVAVGNELGDYKTVMNGIILTSADGAAWTKRNSGTSDLLMSVAYGNAGGSGQFVAVGSYGTILTSPDGAAWKKTRDSDSMYNLASVTYGNAGQSGQFVAVGNNGAILTSLDGNTWVYNNAGTTDPLISVTYGNAGQTGQFVAVGYNGTVLTSPDGKIWKTIKNSNTAYSLACVTYGDSQFVAVGYAPMNMNGSSTILGSIILTSPDGVAWTIANAGTNNRLKFVAFGNGQFIAVGDFGTILTSKADIPTRVALKTDCRETNLSRLKINVTNNSISTHTPFSETQSTLKIGLFTCAGKQVYSTNTGIQNGILNIPAKGFPAGKYFLSITDGNKRTLNSSFVLTR